MVVRVADAASLRVELTLGRSSVRTQTRASGNCKGPRAKGPNGRLAPRPRGSPAPRSLSLSWGCCAADRVVGGLCAVVWSPPDASCPRCSDGPDCLQLASALGAGWPASGRDTGRSKWVLQGGGHTPGLPVPGARPRPCDRHPQSSLATAFSSTSECPTRPRWQAHCRPASPSALTRLRWAASFPSWAGEAKPGLAPGWLLTQAARARPLHSAVSDVPRRGQRGVRPRPGPQQPAVSARTLVAVPPSLLPVRSWPLLTRAGPRVLE